MIGKRTRDNSRANRIKVEVPHGFAGQDAFGVIALQHLHLAEQVGASSEQKAWLSGFTNCATDRSGPYFGEPCLQGKYGEFICEPV